MGTAIGVLVATPVGSTAYNLSAHGPVLPLPARAIALTPIAPAKPRRWPGAILPEQAQVSFIVHAPQEAGVTATAYAEEVRGAAEVEVSADPTRADILLFDRGDALYDRQSREQFPDLGCPAASRRGAATRHGRCER